MNDTEAREKLADAVKYVLNRIAEDPGARWVMGWGTESFRRLCVAWAAHTGRPLHEVEEEARVDRQPPHRRREPEVLELRKRIQSMEGQ